MTPANSKSLLAFIFDQMEKLNRNEITAELNFPLYNGNYCVGDQPSNNDE